MEGYVNITRVFHYLLRRNAWCASQRAHTIARNTFSKATTFGRFSSMASLGNVIKIGVGCGNMGFKNKSRRAHGGRINVLQSHKEGY
jgi:hypothetical protein